MFLCPSSSLCKYAHNHVCLSGTSGSYSPCLPRYVHVFSKILRGHRAPMRSPLWVMSDKLHSTVVAALCHLLLMRLSLRTSCQKSLAPAAYPRLRPSCHRLDWADSMQELKPAVRAVIKSWQTCINARFIEQVHLEFQMLDLQTVSRQCAA